MRLRMLQVATVGLYMGPLLAGLAGQGWVLLPPFAVIFILWLVLLRPHQWPQVARDWRNVSALLAVAVQILSQVLLVLLCMAIGRGIGGVMGYLPQIQSVLPLLLSLASIIVLRLCWDSGRALAEGTSIDNLLYPVDSRA